MHISDEGRGQSPNQTKAAVGTNRVYQVINDKLIECLEAGAVPWRKPWVDGMPVNGATGRKYNGSNALLLNAAPFTSPHWFTFRQVKEQGGQIVKGSKAWPVIYWDKVEKCREQGTPDPSAPEERESAFFLKRYYVFNWEQTQGLPKPPELVRAESFTPIEQAKKLIQQYPDPPRISECQVNEACYISRLDEVRLPTRGQFTRAEGYYSTLFHELSHSTGHPKRLNRQPNPESSEAKNYAQEELVAEISAAYLCGAAGIQAATLKSNAAYIQSWLSRLRADPKLFLRICQQAQRSANLIQGLERSRRRNQVKPLPRKTRAAEAEAKRQAELQRRQALLQRQAKARGQSPGRER